MRCGCWDFCGFGLGCCGGFSSSWFWLVCGLAFVVVVFALVSLLWFTDLRFWVVVCWV